MTNKLNINSMKKLKIIYLGKFGSENSNYVEEDIKSAFEKLGHEVIAVPEKEVHNLQKYKGDMLLFHKAGVGTTIDLDTWVQILNHIPYKKVMWYFDPIQLIGGREQFIDTMADYCEYGFLVDDTWRRRHKYDNLYSLKEGVGTVYKGVVKDEFKCDIAFVGNAYGAREHFVNFLADRFPGQFKAFNNVFKQDLADLSVSAKITVAPSFPTTDFYWSSRFYLTTGLGGFMVHPDMYGLKEEFQEGKHFAGYKGPQELIETINYYLKNEAERKAIQAEGQKRCLEVGRFEHRVKEMLDIIYEKSTPKGAGPGPESTDPIK